MTRKPAILKMMNVLKAKISFRYRRMLRTKEKFNEFRKMHKASVQKISFFYALKYFREWKNSLNYGRGPLADRKPWIVYASFNFLETIIDKNMVVFEFGTGGSSAYFSKNVKKVYSVEHDEGWLQKTADTIREMGFNNWEGTFINAGEDADYNNKNFLTPEDHVSGVDLFKGKNFLDYAASIDRFDDGYFDMVMIDGRARISCFIHAVDKVKKGGYLVLDNAERERYDIIHRQLANDGWVKHSFFGPGPYVNYEFWQTVIWQKIK